MLAGQCEKPPALAERCEAQPALPPSCLEEGMPAKHKNISLNVLSEELKKQTWETQKLQEEVEQATRLTLQRMGRTFSDATMPVNHSSSTSFCLVGRTSEASPEHAVSRQQCQPIAKHLDVNIAGCLNFPGKDVLEHAIEEYSQQVSDLQRQIRETYELHDQQKSNFRQSIIQLQTKLHESQIERDALEDLRMKESTKQSELMGQLQEALQELHKVKQKLMEAEDRAESFSKKAETMEQMLKDMFVRLRQYEKRSGKSSYLCCDGTFSPSKLPLGPAMEKALQDLENESCGFQEKLQLMERQLEDLNKEDSEKTESLLREQKERMERLITNRDQEMATLTEKLGHSQSNAASLQLQVELLQEQVESQTSLHQSQVSSLESALSVLRSELMEKQQIYEAKVNALEEALTLAHSEAQQIQRERDLSLQQAKELDAQLCRLTKELRKTAEELSMEREQRQQLLERGTGQNLTLQSMRQELEQRSISIQQLESLVHSLKEQCQRHLEMQMSADSKQPETQIKLKQLHDEMEQVQQAKDKAMRLQEQSSREAKQLQARLDQQEGELQLQQQEAQQARGQLEEAQTRVQALWAETEVLRMKVLDGEKNTELLRKPLVALQQERNSLAKQLQEFRQDSQQLKAALQEAEVRLSAVGKEKLQQHAVLSERNRSFHQLTLEKQQVTAELVEQRMKLGELKEEQEALREQHNRKTEELQEQNKKLKAHLDNTRTSLEQAKSTLRALEGADGHGLKVALGMQKQITAKREQIDFLQSHVQMLEETTEKMTQEKRYQAKEIKRHVQELHFERESRRRLEAELDTMHTNEKLLKNKAERLDFALHKMSDSFAECQEYIQKQEQEIMRMKLQHALEVKELQGQHLRATGNNHRSAITSPTVPEHLPSFQTKSTSQAELNIDRQRPSPTLELQGLVRELHSVINKDQAADVSLNTRTRSEDSHRTRNEQGPLRMGKQDVNGAFLTANEELGLRDAWPYYRPSSCVAALGRRSPVHSLLTSDVPTDLLDGLKAERPTSALQISASNRDKLTGQTSKELQSKLDSLQNLVEDLQIKNQEMASMIKSQEKRMRKVKDRREPLNR
ncbi:coiled-coil domain-containing protein 158-like isoform X2 [Salminus brasiliensis]|uniref:coiled-coil domain-containing protein 158-like isoform X2 n=2 Tax=Salminus brasiliensis TaxID=930266 RepID=UPI003B83308D